MIERLSHAAFEKIMNGKIKEGATCVIKFYSNECHYCHALRQDYKQISDQFEGVHFFAFNVDGYPHINSVVDINGVPTIAFVKTGRLPQIDILDDPEEKHGETWYHPEDIVSFIKERVR
jgi:thioredoxin-like negative regulator of GroEL